VVNNTG